MTTPWSTEWTGGAAPQAYGEQTAVGTPAHEDWSAVEDWSEREDWAAPDPWTPPDRSAPSHPWTPPDQEWAEEEALADLDESHAVGAEESEQSWEGGVAVLPELLAAETATPGLTTRLAGLAALAVGPDLRRGSTGAAVAALQRVLTDLGHPLAADGDFGARTDAAVRAFQTRTGLSPDGVVGPRTKAALAAALTRRPPGPGPTPTPPAPVPTPPVPGPGPDWSQVPAEQRMRYVMGLLVQRYGYPVNGAAGIVGNLWAESGIIPSRLEGSRPETPMRAPDVHGRLVDFTPDDVVDRGPGRGPRLPGVGLAQWTWRPRREGLFRHAFGGRVLGGAILFDMDAQVDYLVHELQRSYPGVDAVLRRPDVTVDDACDEVLYRFETPGSVLGPDRALLPRSHPQVQRVFAERRRYAHRALAAYRATSG